MKGKAPQRRGRPARRRARPRGPAYRSAEPVPIPSVMKTVLVVDDDADIRTLITWKLSLAGYVTMGACDGEAAVIAANGGSPTSPACVPTWSCSTGPCPR